MSESNNKIATRNSIAAKSNYVFEFNGDGQQCPIKSEIGSGSNNIANISDAYTDTQCVKYTDVFFKPITINYEITTSIDAFVKSPGIQIYRGDELFEFETLCDASSTNNIKKYQPVSGTKDIYCTKYNDSSSKNATLTVKVFNNSWGGDRFITVTCNNESISSDKQTNTLIAKFNTIYFKDFLRNKYEIKVYFSNIK